MSTLSRRLERFVSELKRRHVFQVAAGYAAAAFVVLQVADFTFEPLHLPEWSMTVAVIAVMAGFPITIGLAWLFDITPAGVHRTAPAAAEAGDPSTSLGAGSAAVATLGRRAVVYLASLFVVVLVGFGLAARHLGEDGGELAAAGAAARSIAVLPFADLSSGGANAYFSDGITEDILTALADVGDLRVVSRTSVMAYKGTIKNVRQIGRELGVATVLEGSVRREGDRVRISAQLIDARTDEHLWAETYDRKVDDIFAIQTEIAQEIVQALMVELPAAERAKLAHSATANLNAYDAYLQARDLLASQRTPELEKAVGLLQRALELDPNYALAYAELGNAYFERALTTGQSFWRDSAFAAAQRSLELDSTLAEGHVALGGLFLNIGQARQALEAYDRAVQLKPSHAGAIAGIATVHRHQGRYDEALRWYRKAVEVEPNVVAHRLAIAASYGSLGDFAPARQAIERALRIQPDLWPAHRLAAQIYILEGRQDLASESVRAMLRAARNEPLALAAAGDLELRRGDLDAARRYYQRLLAATQETELEPTTPLGYIDLVGGDIESAADPFQRSARRVSRLFFELGSQASWLYYEMAQIHAAQGDGDGALKYLADAMERGFRDYYQLSTDPLFGALRADARYRQVLSTLKADIDRMRARV